MKKVFLLSEEEYTTLFQSLREILRIAGNVDDIEYAPGYWAGEIERYAERIRDEVFPEWPTPEVKE